MWNRMPNGWYFSSTVLYPIMFFNLYFILLHLQEARGTTCMYKSQKTTGGSWLSPSPVFVPETELRLSSWQQGPLLLSHLTQYALLRKDTSDEIFFMLY